MFCLDIDKRFDYLPGYLYYDILNPTEIKDSINNTYIKPNLIIIDPPFFKLNLVNLLNCVDVLTQGDKNTKIIFAFVHREERALLNIFKSYNKMK